MKHLDRGCDCKDLESEPLDNVSDATSDGGAVSLVHLFYSLEQFYQSTEARH